MFTDDQSRQPSGQSGFVRRNMTNPRFDGDKPAPSYQNNSDYTPPSTPSYGSGGGYNSSPRPPYNPQARRHGGEGGTGGYRGGYTNNRTGGYNRGSQTRDNGGASSDRAIRQNDVIIKLLKEIRDRLPPPPAGTPSYDTADTAQDSYKAEPSYQAASADDDGNGDSDISGGLGNGGNSGNSASAPAGVNTADEEDKFNS